MKNAIENFRLSSGMSFQEIADRCAIRSRSTVFQHCNGQRAISAEIAVKYAKALGIPLSELRPDLWPPEGAAGLPSVCPAAGDVSASKPAGGGEGGRADRAAGEGSPAGATRRRRAACTITRP